MDGKESRRNLDGRKAVWKESEWSGRSLEGVTGFLCARQHNLPETFKTGAVILKFLPTSCNSLGAVEKESKWSGRSLNGREGVWKESGWSGRSLAGRKTAVNSIKHSRKADGNMVVKQSLWTEKGLFAILTTWP